MLPSVSFLVGKHAIPESVISTIQGSGPKNRILKGDILAFLQGKSIGISSVEFESTYAVDIDLSNAQDIAKSKGESIGDLISARALECLANTKGLGVSGDVHFTKESPYGNFVSKINVSPSTKLTASILSKLKDTQDSVRPGSFRLVDSLAFGERYEIPNRHLINGEAGIISLNFMSNSLSFQDDVIDMLTSAKGFQQKSRVASKVETDDIFDFLAGSEPTGPALRIELTVDDRKFENKAVSKYLALLKDTIESEANK